jgi:pimeloyl-ACP methyl ester carboxylesterase
LERFTLPGPDGFDLVGDRGGDPAAPAVIFLHGGGQTRHSWKRGAQRLFEEGYFVLSMDARGHGESGWAPDGDYRNEARARDLAAIVATLPSAPALVGASMGGQTAIAAIGEQPDLASALVLVDVTPRINPEGGRRILEFMRQAPDGFASLEEAAVAIASYNPDRPPPKDLSGLKKNLRERDGRWFWHWDPAFLPQDIRPHEHEESLVRTAARLTLPTLLVRGGASDVVAAEQIAEFRQLMPHAEYVDIAGAGHMVAGDRNDHFNDAIIEFLARVHPARERASG